jgi:hypothetical protein
MKLKYEIERTTDIDVAVIGKRIVAILEKKEYRVLYHVYNIIAFDSRVTRFRGNWEPSQLREGEFKLDNSGDCIKVKLTYHISFTIQFIMLVGWLLLSLFTWDYGFLFLAIITVVFSFIEYINLRMKAKTLINDTLTYPA